LLHGILKQYFNTIIPMIPQPPLQTVKPRVLLVDDSRSVRATLARLLDAVYDIREASDGMEAWATMLIDPTIRIVISDLTMPNLDGYGLLARVRASKIGRIRTMPIVVVSGAQETAEHERVWASGASGLIAKGATRAELLACLALALKAVG
jgi:two-component system cell cycle response regulator